MRWLDQCRDWLKRYDPVRPEHFDEGDGTRLHHYGFMRRLSELCPENAIIVSDTGGNVIMMGHCFRSKAGQRIFTSNGNTPMGFALCGAIGAALAAPERTVVCVIGDGGMQMNIQELETIARLKLPIKVFVINNGILGNTASYQRVNKRQQIACAPPDYSAPDFSAIANAYGIFAAHIPTWIECDSVLRMVFAMNEPVVCDVQDFDRCEYEPRVSRWDAPIEEAYPPLPEEEFLNNMKIKPLDGWKERR